MEDARPRCQAVLPSEVATPELEATGRFAVSQPRRCRSIVMGRSIVMADDPEILARLRALPFVRDGRITLTRRGGDDSLHDAALNQPIVRLRPTGTGDQVALLYPDPRGGWMPPGAFGDAPLPLDEALQAVERAIAFLDHMAEAVADQPAPPRRRRPI